ncbi:hypothetical protein LEP48_11040 [Isoptericola sp. NEAU-Y5]|uniref:Uracil-DNA glycosylase-like domain-containing protein n=1 Tax=Isoptericola luteus TaxID=2879484 RepID=A0ABS7ZFT6_9MICO|nr:uracil-DNA glycosylase family protein [Isoptericola sp. NEAU-Y5]MCA5893883.1 hypothetical protein [Isoptericola sp. NEAU-Y5]
MITDAFDTGPTRRFRTLCRRYPDDTVYRGADGFRSLWGPVFYRGRANGTARLLVVGQDPAQTEAFTRRILSGQAGRRVQGFVEKLGFTSSYLMVNAFLYGIYNQSMALGHLNDPGVLEYRHRWFAAALAPGRVEAVVTFGNPASQAWQTFLGSPEGAGVSVFHQRALHPTADKPGGPISRRDLLDNWNVALSRLHARVTAPDVVRPLVPYGGDLTPGELPGIPSRDLPAGIPPWMRSTDFWAGPGDPPGAERANLTVEVPSP